MRRSLAGILAALLLLAGLCGCGGQPGAAGSAPGGSDSEEIHIVATVFPVYEWLRGILGEDPEGVRLTLLLDNGVDMHSFQPTVADLAEISSCDLIVYVGGTEDEWMEDAVAEAKNQKLQAVRLMDLLGDRVREEEIVEGMKAEEEEHGHEHGEEEPEYDEHIWLSPVNARLCVQELNRILDGLNPAEASRYDAAAAAYELQLADLDEKYRRAVEAGQCRTLMFGDRFPFRYMTEEYGLDYYAAFPGCSAETEASFETIVFLAEKADALDLDVILTVKGSDGRIAETIGRTTGKGSLQVLAMDSMEAVKQEYAGTGATYLSIMEDNLEVLKTAMEKEEGNATDHM
ncbi:MAG: metal ABC transporter substrate-binding protein [Anaerovoracaceae bacterium]